MKMKTPTQLDVVRISGDESAPQDLSRPTMPPESPSTSAASADPSSTSASVEDKPPQQFCLRWNNYQSNLTAVFDQLLQSESFVDVTLACDGHSMKAHKMVLSACSPYFRTLFFENPCQHPIVIMRDIKWAELKAAVEFMYKGEINVSQDQIGPLLRVAESLKIRGLADVGGDAASASETAPPEPPKKPNGDGAPPPPKARKRHHPGPPPQQSPAVLPLPPLPAVPPPMLHADDMEIKPGIAEMIREEERLSSDEGARAANETSSLCNEIYMAKLLESSQAWLGASTSSLADSYQYQLQSMWQKCWNTNQSLVHNLRFRERGPLKSWRPETMAEAIFSVLKEGLSLSQAARKYDIPYPTFVLYANRVHNMLGPSADCSTELRPKGRGRPQRILLGVWPNEHICAVIRAVVFRDSNDSHHIKEEPLPNYPALTDGNMNMPACSNGTEGTMSPETAAAAAMAAVAQGLRQQMCNMVAAAHHAPPQVALSPCLGSPPQPPPAPLALDPQLHLPLPGNGTEHFRPFVQPHQDLYFREELDALTRSPGVSPPRIPLNEPESMSVKLEPFGGPRM